MALLLRGSSQLKNESVTFEKIQNIDHGTILGRKTAGSGKPEALTASEARTELGLSDSDAVSFGSLSSTNITVGASKTLDVSGGTLTLADNQISGDKIDGGNISGDLTLSGSTVSVSNTLSAVNFSSSNVNIDGGAIDGTPIGAASHSTAKFTTLQATGNADLDGDLDVAGDTQVVALTATGLVDAASFHSDSVDIDGGAIDDTIIGGNTPAVGTFTSLESSGNLVVGGNLTVNGGSTTIESTTLSIEDPILHLGKDNTEDNYDLGIVGKFSSSTGGDSVIENNTFDSDLSDWSNISSGTSGNYTWTSEHSSSYGGSVEMTTSFSTQNQGAMIYQSVEFLPDTSGDKSYKFKVDVKNKGFMHSNTQLRLTIWDLESTPNIQGSGTESSNNITESNISSGSTYESSSVTPSTSSLSSGFIVGIALTNFTNFTAYQTAGVIHIDNVKLYEVDNTTSSETEVVLPSSMYTGILRDATDGNFKLFQTPQDLSTSTNLNTSHVDDSGTSSYSKSTLVSTIEGNITFDTARTFSLSGDLSGSQTFDGSGNCEIVTTIQDDSVEFSMLGCEIDEDDMSSNSASHVPTQSSVKAYVDSQVASGGLSDLSAKDIQMVDSTGSFIAVHEEYQFFDISSSDVDNNYVELTLEVDAEFDELSCVYLNGQKLRFGDASTNDYYFANDASSNFKRLNVNSDILEDGDRLEVRFLIKS